MHYTYKKLKDFATRLSQELGLKMSVCREGKSLRYNLSEDLYEDGFAWADINICTYDRRLQQIHLSREIFGGGDWYEISDFDEPTQAMIRQARRRGEPVVWVECAVRTMRNKRYDACYSIERGCRWSGDDSTIEFIKDWLSERRIEATAASTTSTTSKEEATTADDIVDLPF